MDFKIDDIAKDDVNAIHRLGMGELDFSADGQENRFWPIETLNRLVESSEDVTLKLVVNEQIVGFSLVMIHPATKKAVLENFYVIKEYNFLEKDFYEAVENKIRKTDAQFIAYLYDTKEDCNSKELFEEQGYFEGNAHLWLHKNICFSSPKR